MDCLNAITGNDEGAIGARAEGAGASVVGSLGTGCLGDDRDHSSSPSSSRPGPVFFPGGVPPGTNGRPRLRTRRVGYSGRHDWKSGERPKSQASDPRSRLAPGDVELAEKLLHPLREVNLLCDPTFLVDRDPLLLPGTLNYAIWLMNCRTFSKRLLRAASCISRQQSGIKMRAGQRSPRPTQQPTDCPLPQGPHLQISENPESLQRDATDLPRPVLSMGPKLLPVLGKHLVHELLRSQHQPVGHVPHPDP